ncbi:MAG: DDE-type integrase/transposase/recombinase [Candidatus Binataceae bacterium]
MCDKHCRNGKLCGNHDARVFRQAIRSRSVPLCVPKGTFVSSGLLGPHKIGTDGAKVYPTAISDAVKAGLTPGEPTHRVSKYLQQGIESDQRLIPLAPGPPNMVTRDVLGCKNIP